MCVCVCGGGGGGERQTDRPTERQIDRQKGKTKTDRQTDRARSVAVLSLVIKQERPTHSKLLFKPFMLRGS